MDEEEEVVRLKHFLKSCYDRDHPPRKRARDVAIKNVTRLNNAELGLDKDGNTITTTTAPASIEGPAYFYLDGLNPRAREEDPSKRRRVEPGVSQIPREDGRLWKPGEESETFGPEYMADLLRRRDIMLQDPDFRFIELVAGAAYTRVERLYDQESIDTTFLVTQSILSQQARTQSIERERARVLSVEIEELRSRLSSAQRILARVQPRINQTVEARNLLQILETASNEVTTAFVTHNRIRELQVLWEFFSENFGNRGFFTYLPEDYITYYEKRPSIARYIESQLEFMERRQLRGASTLKAFLQSPEQDDEMRTDALTRALFYILAYHMASVYQEVRKLGPPEKEDLGPSDLELPGEARSREEEEDRWGLTAWQDMASDPKLTTTPYDTEFMIQLQRLAYGQDEDARVQLGLVLQTRLTEAERIRQAALGQRNLAAGNLGDFIVRELGEDYEDWQDAIRIVRAWIEEFEPDQRELERAQAEWQSALEALETELDKLRRIERPKIPYSHRMAWVLRPEFSGRVELEPIVQYGISAAWGQVQRHFSQLATAGETAIKHSEDLAVHYAKLVACNMSLAMSRFQVRWLPTRHRKDVFNDLRDAITNLSKYWWNSSHKKFMLRRDRSGNRMVANAWDHLQRFL